MEDFAFTDFGYSSGLIQLAFGIALLLFARGWWRLQNPEADPRQYLVRILGGVIIVLLGLLLITPRSDLIGLGMVVALPAIMVWLVVRKGLPEVSKEIVVLSALGSIGIATALTVTIEYYAREEFSFGGILMFMSGISMAGGWMVAAASLWLIALKKLSPGWKSITYPMQKMLNAMWLGGILLAILLFIFNPVNSSVIYVIKGMALLGGFLFMLPFSSKHASTITYLLAAIIGFSVAAAGYVLKQPLAIALGMITFGASLRATMIRGRDNGFNVGTIMEQLFGASQKSAKS